MEAYKTEFIEFMVECGVLKFGSFTLKSGRKSPFFMNAGAYVTGAQLMCLGEFYAKAICEAYGTEFDVLFGSKLKDGDRVVVIEDVTTSGKSMEETIPILRAQADVEILGLMVSLNRMEVGLGGKVSALDEIRETYGFPANAIVSMAEVAEALYNRPCQGKIVIDDTLKAAIDEYYREYGVKKE